MRIPESIDMNFAALPDGMNALMAAENKLLHWYMKIMTHNTWFFIFSLPSKSRWSHGVLSLPSCLGIRNLSIPLDSCSFQNM
jgi:hypothetical protein